MQPYNNFFPATYPGYNAYQQAYQQQLQNLAQQQTPQTTQQGIQWVQGEAGAKAHNVTPGQSVLLMDSESNAFYIKSTDPSGMPLPLRIFDYTERTAQSAQTSPQAAGIDTSVFVTHEELEARLAALSAPTTTKKAPTKKTTEAE